MIKIYLFLILGLLASVVSYSQNTIKFKIINEEEEPLTGATVIIKDLNIGTMADENGIAVLEN